MWRISAFADEISPDLDLQVETLLSEGIKHIELRGAWGKNVLAFDEAELETVKTTLGRAGISVSSIGSPIGKIKITDDFAPHLTALDRALSVAAALGAPYIRIFSFFMPAGEDPANYREEVLDRMGQIVRRAEGAGVTLVHENEKEIYGDIPGRCLDILTHTNSPILRAVWDPANFVQCGVRPYAEGFAALRPFVDYIHVKDALLATGEVVPAGKGDGEWPETIAALRDSGFDGFFSLEPHLASSGPFSGFSGPNLFRVASQALKDLFQDHKIEWS